MVIGLDASRANLAERTGTERYAFEVIKRLLPLLHQHRVRLYVREALRTDWGVLPSHVQLRVLRWPPAILWSHLRLSWEMFWHRPDVLFVPADTVPLIHPTRTVSTIHDIAFERFPELYRGASVQRRLGWLRPVISLLVRGLTLGRYSASERDYHRWSVRQAVRTCRRLLTVSEFSKQEIVQLLNVPPQRILVTPLGIRPPEYFARISTSRVDQVRQTLGITRQYFLFVGRLEVKKNIGLLLSAYQAYRAVQANPFDLILVGTPGFGWPEAMAHVGGTLPAGTHQLGWQTDEVVDPLFVSASALLLVSAYEGFGIPALEALSAGVPVIASHQGSLPGILQDYATYVDTASPTSLITALRSLTVTPRNHRQRQDAQAYAATFTWDRTAELTYSALIG